MKLLVLNGSPRGKKSNTQILLNHFLNGFNSIEENSHELCYLMHAKDHQHFLKLFQEAENILLAFPLYTDAMPAVVKTFIELLQPFCGKKNNSNIGFIVQSGFPESIHSRFIEKYLEKLARRLGSNYLGTIIKGGCEGIRVAPEIANKNLFKSFYDLGRIFGETSEFDKKIISHLAKPKKYSKLQFWIYKFFAHNFYWNPLLKKNKAWGKSFDKPYIVSSTN